MNNKISLALIDDHAILLEGLGAMLQLEPSFEVVLQTSDAEELLRFMKKNVVDVLITDILMPETSGWELCAKVKNSFPHTKIIALSMSDDAAIIRKMIHDVQVDGYVLKNINRTDLYAAIYQVMMGKKYYSLAIEDRLLQLSELDKELPLSFTPREKEIVRLIAQGLPNKKIGEQLFISERTVETHRKNILRKTNTHTVVELINVLQQIGFQ